MRSRLTLLDLFSTFLQFESDRPTTWAIDARLRRSMQKCLDQSETHIVEEFWAMYWHRQWQGCMATEAGEVGKTTHDGQRLMRLALAGGHLASHLQETCYWAAYKTVGRLEETQLKLSDCFQVAIAAVPKILKAFDPDQVPSLKTYAAIAFGNAIRDELRQRREVDRCNEWGLLLKLSRKQLTEALQQTGVSSAECDRYVLAWSCFTDLYHPPKSPKLRQLQAPDLENWAAIAAYYNQQRHSLAEPGTDCKAATLERWLISCAHHARTYLYPPLTSLNISRPGQDKFKTTCPTPTKIPYCQS
jgi:RNA polymerase sigma factor (sigma-70 family)